MYPRPRAPAVQASPCGGGGPGVSLGAGWLSAPRAGWSVVLGVWRSRVLPAAGASDGASAGSGVGAELVHGTESPCGLGLTRGRAAKRWC